MESYAHFCEVGPKLGLGLFGGADFELDFEAVKAKIRSCYS